MAEVSSSAAANITTTNNDAYKAFLRSRSRTCATCNTTPAGAEVVALRRHPFVARTAAVLPRPRIASSSQSQSQSQSSSRAAATAVQSSEEAISQKWEFWLLMSMSVGAGALVGYAAVQHRRHRKSKLWLGVLIAASLLVAGLVAGLIAVAVTAAADVTEARAVAACVPSGVQMEQEGVVALTMRQSFTFRAVGAQHDAANCPGSIRYRWALSPPVDDRAPRSDSGPDAAAAGWRINEEDGPELFLPDYTLPPGTYQLSVVAGHEGNDQTFQSRTVATVSVAALPMQASIVGGNQSVVQGRAFILDARNSLDPNLDPRLGEPYQAQRTRTSWVGYTFRWTAVDSSSNGGSGGPLILSNGEEFGVRTGPLVVLDRNATFASPRTVTFKLEFSTGDGSRSAEALAVITVTDFTSPAVTILSDNSGLIRSGEIARFRTAITPLYGFYFLVFDVQPRPAWVTNEMLIVQNSFGTTDTDGGSATTTTLVEYSLPPYDENGIGGVDESFLEALWEPGVEYRLKVTAYGQPPGTQITQPGVAETVFHITDIPIFSGVLTEDLQSPHNSFKAIKFDLPEGGTVFSFGLGTVVTPFLLMSGGAVANDDAAAAAAVIQFGDQVTLHPHNNPERQIVGGAANLEVQVGIVNVDNLELWSVVGAGAGPVTSNVALQLRHAVSGLYLGDDGSGRVIYSSTPVNLQFSGLSPSSPIQYGSTYNTLGLSGGGSGGEWKTRAISGITPVRFFTAQSDWFSETPPLTYSLFYSQSDGSVTVLAGDGTASFSGPSSITTTFMPSGQAFNSFVREWGFLIRDGAGSSTAARATLAMFPL